MGKNPPFAQLSPGKGLLKEFTSELGRPVLSFVHLCKRDHPAVSSMYGAAGELDFRIC